MLVSAPREARVCGAVAVEVGAQRDDDARSAAARSSSASMKARALLLVATEREHLLELVDDEHGGVAHGGELGKRVDAGGDDRRAELGTRRALQRGHDARADERRLAAPRRPDDREKLDASSRPARSSTSASRPKKRSLSSCSNGSSPLYGHGTSAGGTE